MNLQLLTAEIYKIIYNLNPMFMAKVFFTKVEPYNLCGSNNLDFIKAMTSLYGYDTINPQAKSYGRVCQEKLKSPNHWRSLEKALSPLKVLSAAVNYAKISFQA